MDRDGFLAILFAETVRGLLVFFFIYYLIASKANAENIIYQVRAGDSLSSILFKHGLKPIYGKNSYLNKVIQINQSQIKKNQLIHAGQFILLPIASHVEILDEFSIDGIHNMPKLTLEDAPNVDLVVPEVSPSLDQSPNGSSPHSYFIVNPYLAFLKLESSNDLNFGGSRATSLSKNGLGLDLSWNITYDENFSYFGYGSLSYFSFYDNSELTYNHLNAKRLNYGIGLSYHFSPVFKLNFLSSMREVLFLDVITPKSVSLESVTVPEMSIGIEQKLISKKAFSLSLGIRGVSLLSSGRENYIARNGYGGEISFEIKNRKKSLFLSYGHRSLQINEIKSKETSLFFGMNFFGEYDE